MCWSWYIQSVPAASPRAGCTSHYRGDSGWIAVSSFASTPHHLCIWRRGWVHNRRFEEAHVQALALWTLVAALFIALRFSLSEGYQQKVKNYSPRSLSVLGY